MVSGAVAGMVSKTVTAPFERLKVHAQVCNTIYCIGKTDQHLVTLKQFFLGQL